MRKREHAFHNHCDSALRVFVGSLLAISTTACGANGCSFDQAKITTPAHWESTDRSVSTFSVGLLDQSANTLPVTWSDTDGNLRYEPDNAAYAEIYIEESTDRSRSVDGMYLLIEICRKATIEEQSQLDYQADCESSSAYSPAGTCTTVDATHRQCLYTITVNVAINADLTGSTETLRGTVVIATEEEYLPESRSECKYVAARDHTNERLGLATAEMTRIRTVARERTPRQTESQEAGIRFVVIALGAIDQY